MRVEIPRKIPISFFVLSPTRTLLSHLLRSRSLFLFSSVCTHPLSRRRARDDGETKYTSLTGPQFFVLNFRIPFRNHSTPHLRRGPLFRPSSESQTTSSAADPRSQGRSRIAAAGSCSSCTTWQSCSTRSSDPPQALQPPCESSAVLPNLGEIWDWGGVLARGLIWAGNGHASEVK